MVTSVFYIGSLLTMIVFTATLQININILYGTISLLGFFMSGYLPVGFELATEVTYPEPEGLSCGLLNSSAQASFEICKQKLLEFDICGFIAITDFWSYFHVCPGPDNNVFWC